MKTFNYYNPVQLHITQKPAELLASLLIGKRILFMTSSGWMSRGILDTLKIDNTQVAAIISNVSANPSLTEVCNLHQQLEGKQFDVIVAVGGGSVIDAAKVCAVQIAHDIADVIKHPQSLELTLPFMPIIAIPTTSGSSSELTPWATVWDTDQKIKYSLHLRNSWCTHAIYCAALTTSLPIHTTLVSSLDALSHAFESIWNINYNEVTVSYAFNAIHRIMQALPQVMKEPQKENSRYDLMLGSMYAGLAFSNTQTSLAHAMSYDMTLNNGVEHGFATSFTLCALLETAIKHNEELHNFFVAHMGKNAVEVLKIWFEGLGISIQSKDYGIQAADWERIKSSLAKTSRVKNSLIYIDDFLKVQL
ncbi:phosphonoacetaldehyde reductase [Paenibacillus endoradicis]|uniref:phosphonoacetaldehyde reductase n=1 Tax=Paenibacillus endoradicis TaxID=2972487 RepID=UPI0021592860|nr:phosphonoacetaldehyde reductase [Paenibacillus endoradicis]MCR8660541.1 phosphonoacetaldehyde reductase [Paenibacillus endoradicis]